MAKYHQFTISLNDEENIKVMKIREKRITVVDIFRAGIKVMEKKVESMGYDEPLIPESE